MSSIKLQLERSLAAAENTNKQEDLRTIEVPGSEVQMTYEHLRVDGEFIATYTDGFWWYDNEPWSDIVVINDTNGGLQSRVDELETFVQRFIDAGFDNFELDRFIALHDDATKLMPTPK